MLGLRQVSRVTAVLLIGVVSSESKAFTIENAMPLLSETTTIVRQDRIFKITGIAKIGRGRRWRPANKAYTCHPVEAKRRMSSESRSGVQELWLQSCLHEQVDSGAQ